MTDQAVTNGLNQGGLGSEVGSSGAVITRFVEPKSCFQVDDIMWGYNHLSCPI
jgi:hypothetical protein